MLQLKQITHEKICKNLNEVNLWFKDKSKELYFPIYSSFDIRDSGSKIAPVDANIYPAGFNNICQDDKEVAPELIKKYISLYYPHVQKKIMLLAEEHTNNPYYWENIKTLRDLISEAGFEVELSIPSDFNSSIEVQSLNGEILSVKSAQISNGKVICKDFDPELIICNNDFSKITKDWVGKLFPEINPPPQLGWYQRKKSDFFLHYNALAKEFSDLIGVPKNSLTIRTQKILNFDMDDEEGQQNLLKEVDSFISDLKKDSKDPFVFIKNNSGTYGMGIAKVRSGEEVIQWNSKLRKKMRASKSGVQFGEVILQEGIPTVFTSSEETAEPAIYMIGSQLAGGFLRTHTKKGPEDNLNSRGAVFKRLCLSDVSVNAQGLPMENVYGWVSKIGSLAIGLELKGKGFSFPQT